MKTEFIILVAVLIAAAYLHRCKPCAISMEGV